MLGIQGLSGSGESTGFIFSLIILYLFDFIPMMGLEVFLLAFLTRIVVLPLHLNCKSML